MEASWISKALWVAGVLAGLAGSGCLSAPVTPETPAETAAPAEAPPAGGTPPSPPTQVKAAPPAEPLPRLGPPPSARKILRLPLTQLPTRLDPGLVRAGAELEVSSQLFIGLTRYIYPEGIARVVPDLATDWEVSPDGLRYVFHLRPARWSDGTPLTAHDVVYAARRNIRPSTGSPYAHLLEVLLFAPALLANEEQEVAKLGVRALDDRTVEFRLRHPAAHFPGLAGLWPLRPLPRHLIERQGAGWSAPGRLVSSGPYRVSRIQPGQWLLLERAPDFYQFHSVAIPAVLYKVVSRSLEGLSLYEEGELDLLTTHLLPVPRTMLEYIRSSQGLRRELSLPPSLCMEYYVFNPLRPPLDNLQVRKSLAAEVNPAQLVETVLGGMARPLTALGFPPLFGASPPGGAARPPAEDPPTGGIAPSEGGASQAGAASPGAEPVTGKDTPPLLLAFNGNETNTRVAQALSKRWTERLGFTFRLVPQEWRVYNKNIKDPDAPHMFRVGWCADFPDLIDGLLGIRIPAEPENRFLAQGRKENEGSREVTQLLLRAQAEADPLKRVALYHQVEQVYIHDQALIVPLFGEYRPTLSKPYVFHTPAPLGSNEIRDWKLGD
ncbi:MAG: peptide ABC transporter substrate-binding protein [Deltaproteobacteria bacterium]|nr:peptide ABC transporter substrate-binding protein [Deltaproteobacteria bacterium]